MKSPSLNKEVGEFFIVIFIVNCLIFLITNSKPLFLLKCSAEKVVFLLLLEDVMQEYIYHYLAKGFTKKTMINQASRIERIFLTKKRNFRIKKYFSACSKSIRAIKATMWIETTQRYLQALNDFELFENAMPSSNFETHRVKILV